jgi:hypothetical protein
MAVVLKRIAHDKDPIMKNRGSSATLAQPTPDTSAFFAQFTPFPRVELDTRLIAAVQNSAGVRCHRSANLLYTYYLCADVYRSRLRHGDADASNAARQRFQESENRLREFLFACRPSACWATRFDQSCVA